MEGLVRAHAIEKRHEDWRALALANDDESQQHAEQKSHACDNHKADDDTTTTLVVAVSRLALVHALRFSALLREQNDTRRDDSRGDGHQQVGDVGTRVELAHVHGEVEVINHALVQSRAIRVVVGDVRHGGGRQLVGHGVVVSLSDEPDGVQWSGDELLVQVVEGVHVLVLAYVERAFGGCGDARVVERLDARLVVDEAGDVVVRLRHVDDARLHLVDDDARRLVVDAHDSDVLLVRLGDFVDDGFEVLGPESRRRVRVRPVVRRAWRGPLDSRDDKFSCGENAFERTRRCFFRWVEPHVFVWRARHDFERVFVSGCVPEVVEPSFGTHEFCDGGVDGLGEFS